MNLYISDLHFGHENVLRLDGRPFSSVDEMDRMLIRLWNGRVQNADDVYVLGDFAYRNNLPEEWYLGQLKGHKHLIIGNHDGRLLKNTAAMKYFESAEKMMHVKDGTNHICLCHFPICDWNGRHRGHMHIYGHIHNRTDGAYSFMKSIGRAYNAGCMINHYMPVSLKELIRNNEVFWSENDIITKKS